MTANLTKQEKTIGVLLILGVGALAFYLNAKKREKKSNFDDVFNQDRTDNRTGVLQSGADGVLDEYYDFDADYDFDGPNDFYDADGDDFYDADGDDFYNAKGKQRARPGGGGKKRQLKKWQRRVKVLSRKIQMANKGLIKAQNKVSKWQTKLTQAQEKVAELSN